MGGAADRQAWATTYLQRCGCPDLPDDEGPVRQGAAEETGFVESLLCLIGLDWESPKAPAAINLLVQHGWLVALDPQAVVRDIARKEAWRIVRPGNVV